MPPFVPPEVIQLILDQVSDRGDLARCCSTSKTFLSIARSLLYHSVEIEVRVRPSDHYRFDIKPASDSLLLTIRRFTKLRQLVRRVSLIKMPAYCSEPGWDSKDVGPETILQELLETMPLVKSFVLQDFHSLLNLDKVVSQHQSKMHQGRERTGGGNGSGPEFSLGWRWSTFNFEVGDLSGAYAGFECMSAWLIRDRLDLSLLHLRSKNTLRYLSIPLDSLTQSSSISTLPCLRRLSVRLNTTIRDISLLKIALSSTPSLLSLHLHGPLTRETLSKLIMEEEFAKSLPPLLSHLSLNYQLPSTQLSSFIGHLPPWTSLKRLCCLKKIGYHWESATGDSTRSEEAETLAVVEKYRSRGIKLSFDEKYKIW